MARGDKLLSGVSEQLQPNESVLLYSSGSCVSSTRGKERRWQGVVFVTETRIGFYAKLLGESVFISIRYQDLTSINFQRNMLGLGTIEATTSNQNLTVGSIAKDIALEMVNLVEARRGSPQPISGVPASGTLDPVAQLSELAALRAQGVLSDDEFNKAKSDLLGRI